MRERGRGRRFGLPLLDLGARRAPRAEVIVVDPEALVQPVPARQHHRRDHGGGVVTALRQELGQRRHAGREDEGAVVAHAVARREEPGEDRGVRRQGDRGRAVAALEAHSAAGQRVQVRRRRMRPAGAPQMVGTRRVEGEENDVGAARRGRRRRGPAAAAARAGGQASSHEGSTRGDQEPRKRRSGHRFPVPEGHRK